MITASTTTRRANLPIVSTAGTVAPGDHDKRLCDCLASSRVMARHAQTPRSGNNRAAGGPAPSRAPSGLRPPAGRCAVRSRPFEHMFEKSATVGVVDGQRVDPGSDVLLACLTL